MPTIEPTIDESAAELGAGPGGGATTSRLWFGIPRSHVVVLVLLAVSYTSVLTYLCQLRYENFFDGAFDLGLNQQMLWSTSHGLLLYEAPDKMYGPAGGQSFLEIHSTYIALLFVPLYTAVPYPATLFALQSAAVAAASVPLYLIARNLRIEPYQNFSLVALFLLNFAIISALFYAYHWEAFLPAEFLWFYYLTRRRSYRLALVPMVAGILTLEVFPFLVAGLVLLVILERLQALGIRPRTWFQDREIQVQLAFLAAAVVAYLSIRFLQYQAIPQYVGSYNLAYQVSGSVTGPFALTAGSLTLPGSLLYWVLLLAALGFLPLYSPKSLLLSLPWFVESVFLFPPYSEAFGTQYALVAMATLSVGLVEGFAVFDRRRSNDRRSLLWLATLGAVVGFSTAIAAVDSDYLLTGQVDQALWLALLIPPLALLTLFTLTVRRIRTPRVDTPDPRNASASRARRLRTPAWIGIIAILIAFNFAIGPFNPTNFGETGKPGYEFEWPTNPVYPAMSWLGGFVPPDAQILVADNIFPFAANDPHAWATPTNFWGFAPAPPYLPFNGTDLPAYVLTDSSEWSTFPPGVQAALLNGSTYGLVAYVYSDGLWPGSVYLFERGFHGSPGVRLASPFVSEAVVIPQNLTLGPSGQRMPSTEGAYGSVIESSGVPGVRGNLSEVWESAWMEYPSGLYRLSLNLSGTSNDSISRPSTTVLQLNVTPYLLPPAWLTVNVTASQLTGPGWETLTYVLPLVLPYPLVDLQGNLCYTAGRPNGEVELNYLELQPI
jgi:uncharacterized membrane protein